MPGLVNILEKKQLASFEQLDGHASVLFAPLGSLIVGHRVGLAEPDDEDPVQIHTLFAHHVADDALNALLAEAVVVLF